MAEATFSNVQQILRRTIKNDGRAGGMQKFVGKDVDIVVYNEEDEGN